MTSILIEEAFTGCDQNATERVKATGHAGFCGITLGGESDFFLSALLQIDAKAQSGTQTNLVIKLSLNCFGLILLLPRTNRREGKAG